MIRQRQDTDETNKNLDEATARQDKTNATQRHGGHQGNKKKD